jgi:hypothetical protein
MFSELMLALLGKQALPRFVADKLGVVIIVAWNFGFLK